MSAVPRVLPSTVSNVRRFNGHAAKPVPGRVWLLAAAVAALAVYLGAPHASARTAFGHLALAVMPLTALAACTAAARAVPAGRRTPWRLLAGACVAGWAGHAWWAIGPSFASDVLWPSFLLFLFCYALLALGLGVALSGVRSGRGAVEVALDAGIVVVAGAVVVLRFGAGPEAGTHVLGPVEFGLRLAGQLFSVAAAFFGLLLAVGSSRGLPSRAVGALACAAAAFAVAELWMGVGADLRLGLRGGGVDLLWFGGWGLLAYAGLAAVADPAGDAGEEASGRVRRRLRHGVAPAAAFFLGLAALDNTLRGRAERVEIGVALGVLGVLLATRIRHALVAMRRQGEERRQLAHTRALIEVSHALADPTELDRTLELVAYWAARLLNAGAAGIELLVEHGHALELRAAYRLPPHVLGMRFGLDGSFTGWVVRHGRSRATVDPFSDPLIHPQSLEFLGHAPVAAAPLVYRGRPLGALFACYRDTPFDDADLELLGALADQAAIAIENARLFEQVRALSLTDPLTGLANRRQLERELAREFAAARRGRRVVAVVFDLDGFKAYNDRYGHLAGDELLRAFGDLLASETRAMNLAARYGGDEFVVLLSDSDRASAQAFVDRVQAAFPQRAAQLGRAWVTVSAGVAEYDPSMQGPHDLIAAADRALYEAKSARAARARAGESGPSAAPSSPGTSSAPPSPGASSSVPPSPPGAAPVGPSR